MSLRNLSQMLAATSILALSGCGDSLSMMHSTDRTPALPTPPVAAAPTLEITAPNAVAGPTSEAPVKFDGNPVSISLYGELPNGGQPDTNDASENLRQISFTREGADFDVDLDPSGKWIAFASTQHRKTSDIYIKRVDGQTVTQITSDSANDVMPAISPDGMTLAYCSDRMGNWDIYLQKIEGGKPIQLTSDPAHEVHPSWSPDGKQIVFSSLGRQSGQWEIVVVDVENPAKRKFIGFGLFPRFSPMGDKIVFQKARQRGSRTFSIWTMDYINGEGTHPTEIAAAVNAAVINPAWSPDGKRLAFATVVEPSSDPNTRPKAADLWAINLDGTGRVKLTNDHFANLQPAWGKDGAIYFISNRSGFDNVWALRASSGTVFVEGPKPATSPAHAEVPTP